jgi:hypothetical protein
MHLELAGLVLTYMSIDAEIVLRIAEGRLFRLSPSIPGDPEERTVLVSREIRNLLEGPWANDAARRRCGRLRADFESIIKGEVITVSWTPYQAGHAMIGKLDADEVYDLRSQDPKPGLRVFFRFADRDVMVALTCGPRSVNVDWLPREPLGHRYSREWRDAIEECKAEWRKLFPAHSAHTGDSLHDYISSNAVLV